MSITAAPPDVATWAAQLIREARAEWGGRSLARYGTPEWTAMPPRQRWAAILLAAECWRSEGTTEAIAERFAIEIDQARWTTKQAEDQEYQARAAAHAREWRYLRGGGRRVEIRDDIDDPEPWDGAA